MKRIQYHRYGGPETMALEDFELRLLATDQVAVRVKAAAINPIDWKLRRGDLKMMTGRNFPRGLGSDFAGEVIGIGPDVTRVAVGDAVFGLASLKDSGAIAEEVVTADSFLARKPAAMPFEEAACIGTVGVTAWIALVDKADIGPGKSVFINGCTGGVGLAAVQIANALGATVYGSCRASMISVATASGVAEAFDYRTLDLSALRKRFDAVIDTAGVIPIGKGLSMLKKGGAFIPIIVTPMHFLRSMFQRRMKIVVCAPRADIMDGLAGLASRDALSQPIAERSDLEDAVAFVRRFEERPHSIGKGVVLPV